MPFRFRKIISLGKGFRINLSKSGISSSIGGKGFTVNFGKRGIRPTVSAPGTGISYTPSLTSGDRDKSRTANQLTTIIIGGIGLICIIIICCILLVVPQQIQTPTATPASSSPETCSCNRNLYSCSDFTTHAQAQTCFDECRSKGYGDVHKLDRDNDGLVCETLP